jgi:hypothetical protein
MVLSTLTAGVTMNIKPIIAALVAGLVTAPGVSYAGWVTFCVKHTGAYDDNDEDDAEHDFWTDDLPKLARGAYTSIWVDQQTMVFGDELGDGFGGTTLGCTPQIWIASGVRFLEFYVESDGYKPQSSPFTVPTGNGFRRLTTHTQRRLTLGQATSSTR